MLADSIELSVFTSSQDMDYSRLRECVRVELFTRLKTDVVPRLQHLPGSTIDLHCNLPGIPPRAGAGALPSPPISGPPNLLPKKSWKESRNSFLLRSSLNRAETDLSAAKPMEARKLSWPLCPFNGPAGGCEDLHKSA